jgi:hypothetical protein
MLIVLSKPHEYWRWRDHTTTYTEFKKEMWGNSQDLTLHTTLSDGVATVQAVSRGCERNG